jgi:hypothetical protein
MKIMSKAYKKLNYTLDNFRLYLSMIILHLNRNDLVAADRVYQEALSYALFFSRSPYHTS